MSKESDYGISGGQELSAPTPIGRDKAARNLAEVISIMESSGNFGRPTSQSSAKGIETLFRCPLCEGEGHDTKGRNLRVARRLEGGETPYVGCRTHSGPEDWKRLKAALLESGVPARLIATGGNSGGYSRPEATGGFPERPEGLGEADPVDPEAIAEWAERLWSPTGARYLAYLRKRGLSDTTIVDAQLGVGAFAFGPDKKPQPRITIPIIGADGSIVNVRLSSIKAGVKRLPLPHPEMLNEEGDRFLTYGSPTRLYGVDRLAAQEEIEGSDNGDPVQYVFVVAGEWDMLLLRQYGFLAVTGTGGETTLPWKRDGALLRDRHVIVIYDCDDAGRKGARKFAQAATEEGALSVRVIDLDPTREDGYDVADFLLQKEDPAEELIGMVAAAPLFEAIEPSVGEKRRGPAWEYSDLGVAEQVAFRDGGVLKFVSESRTWISWNEENGLWTKYGVQDDIAPQAAITEYVREAREELRGAEEDSPEEAWAKFIYQYLNSGKSFSAMRKLSNLWEMRVSINDIDAQPHLLNVRNGTLDLETGRLFDPAPEDFLTKRTNGAVLLDTSKVTEGELAWKKIIERTVPDPDTRLALQMISGISLLDGNPLQIMVFLLGVTGTGKSVFAELFAYAIGDYAGSFNLSMMRDNQDERPRADLVRALTQRVIFASEASEQWRLHSDQIKRLTGEDSIPARLPHSGEYIERVPAFIPWLRTNQAPRIESADLALYRRLMVFPFEQTYVRRKGEEGSNVRGSFVVRTRDLVADAIVTWAIEGLLTWQDSGAGEVEKSHEMVRAEAAFRDALNDTQGFLSEETEPDGSGRVVFKELYDRYVNWAFDAGIATKDVLTKKGLGDRLTGLGYVTQKSNGVTYRIGLVFKKVQKEVR